VFLNAAMSAALDRITERAADVRRAFTPGALPRNDDVASSTQRADFTLDPLSVAPPDGAYFVTVDAHGRTAYTRDGGFALSGGRLVDSGGLTVLGRRTLDGPLGPLQLDPVDATLGRAADVRVQADGSLVYTRAAIDPRSGKRSNTDVVAGRVALARFPAGTKLASDDGHTFSLPTGTQAQLGRPGDDGFGALAPMHRARSRVDLDVSLMRLKDAYVAFDALAAAETAKDRFGKAAMDVVK
jgi:flagellar basal body rod protein FlgG